MASLAYMRYGSLISGLFLCTAAMVSSATYLRSKRLARAKRERKKCCAWVLRRERADACAKEEFQGFCEASALMRAQKKMSKGFETRAR